MPVRGSREKQAKIKNAGHPLLTVESTRVTPSLPLLVAHARTEISLLLQFLQTMHSQVMFSPRVARTKQPPTQIPRTTRELCLTCLYGYF